MNSSPDVADHPERILIVDDEQHNRQLLEVMLGAQGYVLLKASSGEEALAIVAGQAPDLVLLDIMMPGMDGYQVARQLKRNPKTTNIPIIMITVLDDREAQMLGLSAGAEDFLTKPVDRAELRVRVKNLLRLKAYGDYHGRYSQLLESEVGSRTAELVASERLYRSTFDAAPVGIAHVGLEGEWLQVNQRLSDLLGYSRSELQSLAVGTIMQPEDAAQEALSLRQLLGGTLDRHVIDEKRYLRKDGSAMWARVNISVHRDAEDRPRHFIMVIEDITERRDHELREAKYLTEHSKMQEQLMMSDRMVSMGTVAAGVAHEINNPLASVMANLELAATDVAVLVARLDAKDVFAEVQAELQDARLGAERIRNIVGDLRIFSRAEEDKGGPVDVHCTMESTLRMAWNEIRHRARLVRNYGEIPLVTANESRLGQVFLNLIVNAAQAIEEGRADRNEIRISTSAASEGAVIVEITDTGSGIPPEVLAKMFTPFFTTKPIGLGTGLGLSICHRIVAGLGGAITVESKMGTGTTFRVSLPAAARTQPVDEIRRAGLAEVPAARRGRVLAVDDEPMMTKAVQRILCPDHDVVAINSAEEALRRISAGERFDAIICDLMMPQMTGMDLHLELLRVARDQAARMIFVTGGTFTPRARIFLDETPNQRLEKPFDIVHLRALVNDQIR